MSDALAYLAEYSPATLDTILDVIGTPIAAPDSDLSEEPFCVTCDAPLAICLTCQARQRRVYGRGAQFGDRAPRGS